MKTIFNPSDTLINKISFYHLLLFVATLPFDQFYSQLVLISFVLHTIISFKKENLTLIFRKETLILSSVFLVTAICTLYSNNQKEAFSLLSRQTAILLFPVVLLLNPIDLKKYTRHILLCFAFSCTLTVVYLYADAIRIIRYNHLPFSALFSPAFTNHNFSNPIDIHATYFSLYVALGLFALVNYAPYEKSSLIMTIYMLAGCTLLAGLFQLGSKAVLIAVLFFFCIVYPLSLLRRRKAGFVALSLLLASAILFTVAAVPPMKSRFLNGFVADLSEKTPDYSIAAPRMKRWELAFDLVKGSPLIGYGSGEEEDLLKEKYFENKLYDAYLNRLNAHNQYISFLLMGGVLALAIYLLTLLYGLKLSIRSKNIVFTGFLLLLLIVSLSENILFRNKGIFFYSFFFSLFVCAECGRRKVAAQQKNETGNLKKQKVVFITNT